MERTRHMVEIADSSWEKLERLAYRLDAAQYIYKGRPRYGKLLELAIEKLEDSTMEWTEEEIPGEQGYDIIGALEDVLQDATIEMPPKGYTFGYNTPQGEPVYYKEKSKDIKFTLSAKPIDPDLLKETQETVGKAMAIHLEKAVKEAIVSGKPKQSNTSMLDAFKKNALPNIFGLDDVAPAASETAKSTAELAQLLKDQELAAHGFTQPVPHVPYIMWKTSQPGYIELGGTLTQALSASQQTILRNFALAAFAEFSNDESSYALSVSMNNMPWSKLWISATYADPSKLTAKLQDIGKTVSERVETWLLQGNFIGPLPKAVDIAEEPVGKTWKPVSCQHKIEKAIDKNGTLQKYDTYSIKVNLSPFDAIALNDNKHVIADRLKILLLNGHGYPIHGAIAGARILWDDDHDGTIRISVSIIRKLSSPFKGYSQEFVDSSIKYLEDIVTAIQNHHAIKSESYNPPL